MSVARRISDVLKLDYRFPINQDEKTGDANNQLVKKERNRIKAINDPDTLLLAVVVVSTKLCFPFENVAQAERDDDKLLLPKMDWSKWMDIMETSSTEELPMKEVDYKSITTEQLVSMNPEELDKFFAKAAAEVDIRSRLIYLPHYLTREF